MYGAPSMGSETTLPYAWLLWRFKNTLANPVTWCCRCLYDMLRKVNFAKSAQRNCKNVLRTIILRACILSLMLQLNFKLYHVFNAWYKIYQYVLSIYFVSYMRVWLVRISQTFPELSIKEIHGVTHKIPMWIIVTEKSCINIILLRNKIIYSAKSRQVWLY